MAIPFPSLNEAKHMRTRKRKKTAYGTVGEYLKLDK